MIRILQSRSISNPVNALLERPDSILMTSADFWIRLVNRSVTSGSHLCQSVSITTPGCDCAGCLVLRGPGSHRRLEGGRGDHTVEEKSWRVTEWKSGTELQHRPPNYRCKCSHGTTADISCNHPSINVTPDRHRTASSSGAARST